MSKIEEALEKARRLKESTDVKKPYAFGKVESLKVDNPYIISITQPDSPIAEEYRKLKSMVIRDTKTNFLNTVMLSSTIEGEGKTLTAINLAVSMAQELDHTVLLIDADLRRPLIHEYFGIKHKFGLSDYLARDIDITEILIKTGIGNLVIIPGGSRYQNPVELLSSGKMRLLLEELKHRYMDRYIIIDTPPLLPFAESITIASYVDGLIFVIREGYAQLKAIKEALNLIKNTNILGVVFNNVSNVNLEGYYYYRYHRYYYSQREK